MDIKNKTIIITGAARGLGAAMAEKLAGHNCKLGLIDLDKDSIAKTASACEAAGAEVMCVSADVTKEDDVINLVRTFSSRHRYASSDCTVINRSLISCISGCSSLTG